jgi:hypothetical protein
VHHNLTTYSASTFAIVRIPYLHSLKVSSDFLYAATDVSIWYVAETGLAILACAATNLRPLFRTLSSRLFATAKESFEVPRKTWPSTHAGYILNGKSNYHGFEENTRAQAESRPDIIINNDAIYLARWAGD